jgi:hypothetical protein
MAGGRPTKYKREMCATVIECGKEGMGKAEMACELGIHHSTFAAWQEKHPEFSEAVKEALLNSQAWWERNGRVATFGGVEGFNATSYIFQMKNRFPLDWRDKREHEHAGKDGGDLVIKWKS